MDKILKSNTLNTPYLTKMISEDIEELIASSDLTWNLNKNKEVVEEVPNYPGCRLRYGIKDKKIYAIAEQDDLDKTRAYCKAYREELNAGNLAKKRSMAKWAMPWIIEQELLARGWPLAEMQRAGEHSDLDRYFEYEAPEFKLTPATLTTLPRMKMF